MIDCFKGAVGALMLGLLVAFHAAPARAAVLSTGGQTFGSTTGGFVCADVTASNEAAGTPIDAFDCHAAGNQQFELSGLTVFDLGGTRCMDTLSGGKKPGTPVVSTVCTGGTTQKWHLDGSMRMVHLASGFCLDAGNLANGTQLVINPCTTATSQVWEVK